MKLIKSQLKKIIKEEFEAVTTEGNFVQDYDEIDAEEYEQFQVDQAQAAAEDVAISIPEVSPGATIQDEELDQEIEIYLTDNSGEDHLVTITLRQLVRAARGS